MAFAAVSVLRGPGEIAAMVVEVTKRIFTRPFQFREFVEQAWFITSVTLMPTILVSIPFGAVISLQVGNLTGQLGAQSFAGATAVLASLPDLYISMIKAIVFGWLAAIVGAYKGLNAGGGPSGVGRAVNESVIIAFMLLFFLNAVITAIYFQVVPPPGL